jgi:hypothetical protein
VSLSVQPAPASTEQEELIDMESCLYMVNLLSIITITIIVPIIGDANIFIFGLKKWLLLPIVKY